MSSYEGLAASYDALTTDVGYEKRADFLEKLFRRSRIPVHTVLDLACGTGTMTWLLTDRGYELIGVDGSEEMLAAAMEKSGQVEGIPPIFLHQSMPQLDLYGTVDAAICCLDSLNYLTRPADVQRTFRRLHLFIAPGGLLVFGQAGGAGWTGLSGRDGGHLLRLAHGVSPGTVYLLHGSLRPPPGRCMAAGAGDPPAAGLYHRGAHRLAEGCRFQRYPHLGRRKAAPSHGKRAADLFFLYQRVRSFS